MVSIMNKLGYIYCCLYLIISSFFYFLLSEESVLIKLLCFLLLFVSCLLGCLYHKAINELKVLMSVMKK